MKKTLMLAAALCALLPFASCGGKKSDAKASSGSGAAVEAGGSTKDADKAAEKAAKDAKKALKGAKDAAGAFELSQSSSRTVRRMPRFPPLMPPWRS